MYLSELSIINFRKFGDPGITLSFRPGANVIIGENNSGKSAIIDAIRLVLSLGDARRDIYVSPSDFHRSSDGTTTSVIFINLVFEGLCEKEESAVYDLLVPGAIVTAEIHLRYELRKLAEGVEKIHVDVWGGKIEDQPVSAHTLEQLNHVYLGPLRDAERFLRPGRDNRLGQLVRKVVASPADREQIMGCMRQANAAVLQGDSVNRAAEIVNTNLAALEGARLAQKVAITISQPDFGRVADSLVPFLIEDPCTPLIARFPTCEWTSFLNAIEVEQERKLLETAAEINETWVNVNLGNLSVDHGCLSKDTFTRLLLWVGERLSLELNGMGYNNLIYMATAMGDLRQLKCLDTESYDALLVEEPEAHLHPQLQRLVCQFLEKVSDPDQAAASVQVFFTSHSPTLTCKVPLDSLIILQASPGSVRATPFRTCAKIDPQDKKDLQRYLDVTRSQLFFAKGVLLVEGISEALTIPLLAQRLGRSLDENAVEVVNVSGTSFGPFAQLFRGDTTDVLLDIPAVILTDNDRCTGNENDPCHLTNDDLSLGLGSSAGLEPINIQKSLAEIVRKLDGGLVSARSISAQGLAGERL
ncbi:MAG: AAA family ATPase, partial [Syntrophobacteraceae bacterium]